MTYGDALFDKAYLVHVGMSYADKSSLMTEIFRVLKPGGRLGVFGIMRTSDSELVFPLPWAGEASGSALVFLDGYKLALEAAGFQESPERSVTNLL